MNLSTEEISIIRQALFSHIAEMEGAVKHYQAKQLKHIRECEECRYCQTEIRSTKAFIKQAKQLNEKLSK